MGGKDFNTLYREAVQAPTPAQTFLARVKKATGRSPEAVYKWLQGAHRPPDKVIEALAEEFNTPAEVLFPREVD